MFYLPGVVFSRYLKKLKTNRPIRSRNLKKNLEPIGQLERESHRSSAGHRLLVRNVDSSDQHGLLSHLYRQTNI